ncbi:conserved hypothetical protein [Hyella patelloides LEGE 07179]|uniref:CRISPR type III-associated protein domain-containing protein n=1 Tax=Hyella patelloides LEGE 07179 TaxID=945734 RepID=A0A563VTX5_9CYAN|nr:RAMP superfamily CRISPR-associated protein [Hyella patelloides]VEP14885.1 conserved hypothetical protein [Hyella patelloides LEGE 07179]VEP14900.1 conserved hypothetical protein [Hyella patelloides LEGE 07179]
MTTTSLPDKLPDWYGLEEPKTNNQSASQGDIAKSKKPILKQKQPDKGWSPQTTHIKNITETWWGKDIPPANQTPSTIELDNLSILSPLQIGGGALPEGHNLPAQISGVSCIPGSSLRGSFLRWIVSLCQEYERSIIILTWYKCFPQLVINNPSLSSKIAILVKKLERNNLEEASLSEEEYLFWDSYLFRQDRSIGWKPKAIRFETTYLKNLTAFPLHPQQDWQVFGKKDNKLAVMWQFPAIAPQNTPKNSTTKNKAIERFSKNKNSDDNPISPLKITFHNSLASNQKEFVSKQLRMMLLYQGLGKGLASGFGRIGNKNKIPPGKWKIKLKGMKPAIENKKDYRWSPQVLRACLRGHFIRLALTMLNRDDAIALTNTIFGSSDKLGQLSLTSYLVEIKNRATSNSKKLYSNIPKNIVDEIWIINVDCNREFHFLIDNLLSFTSQIGGLGRGWRRPRHHVEREKEGKDGQLIPFSLYFGSSFEVNSSSIEQEEIALIHNLQSQIKQLAIFYQITTEFPQKTLDDNLNGAIISLWKSKQNIKQHYRNELIHCICSTNKRRRNNQERPDWCGDNESRPSGYAISDRGHYNLVSVFDSEMHKLLINEEIAALDFNLWNNVWSCC